MPCHLDIVHLLCFNQAVSFVRIKCNIKFLISFLKFTILHFYFYRYDDTCYNNGLVDSVCLPFKTHDIYILFHT